MDTAQVIDLARQAIQITLIVSLPLLATAFLVGLIVSGLQAMTQIQDQSIATVVKLVAIFIVLLCLMPWFVDMITDYGNSVVKSIPAKLNGSSHAGFDN